MSYVITSESIVRNRCSVGCPTNATSFDQGVLLIDSTTCNHYRGCYKSLQYAAVRPADTDCSPSNPRVSLASDPPQADYWEKWFSRYKTLLKWLEIKSRPALSGTLASTSILKNELSCYSKARLGFNSDFNICLLPFTELLVA
ncbi:MAG: hypothetical protein ACTMUB_02325 [cyanobacterium endosymbiont of Rhopalodia musculus]